MSYGDINVEALRWEEGCRKDVVRNQFIIPEMAALISSLRPKSVLDVGSGTAYVPRQIHTATRPQVRWSLVDLSDSRMNLARNLVEPDQHVEFIAKDIFTVPTSELKSDVVLLCNSIMEMPLDSSQTAHLASIPNESGHIIIFMPDPLSDILSYEKVKTLGMLEAYISADLKLDKVDKFTGKPYPFIAHRPATIIMKIMAEGYNLVMVKRSNIGGGYFLFGFRRVMNGI